MGNTINKHIRFDEEHRKSIEIAAQERRNSLSRLIIPALDVEEQPGGLRHLVDCPDLSLSPQFPSTRVMSNTLPIHPSTLVIASSCSSSIHSTFLTIRFPPCFLQTTLRVPSAMTKYSRISSSIHRALVETCSAAKRSLLAHRKCEATNQCSRKRHTTTVFTKSAPKDIPVILELRDPVCKLPSGKVTEVIYAG